MNRILLAVALIVGSASSTITILAACGSSFTPSEPDGSNVTFWGSQCSGSFGKKHTWHLYYTDGHETPAYEVSEPAACLFVDGANHPCYPAFNTPAWMDDKKNKWNETTRAPTWS